MSGQDATPLLPDCHSGIGSECKDWGDAGDPPRRPPTTAQLERQARHPIAWIETGR